MNKGITLIALVVTIVILVILSTVTIGVLNRGIIDKSRAATSDAVNGQAETENEMENLKRMYNTIMTKNEN